MQRVRPTLASFYHSDAQPIIMNSNVVPNPAAVQENFLNNMPATHIDVRSYDVQVLNPMYPTKARIKAKEDEALNGGVSTLTAKEKASLTSDISLLLSVNGTVRYSESKDVPPRGFHEIFLLTPNEDAHGASARDAKRKKFLIKMQTSHLIF